MRAFLVLEGQSKLILIVVLPRDDGVTLPREVVKTLNEATVKEDVFGRVIYPSACTVQSLGALCVLSRAGNHSIHDFVNLTVQCNLVVNAVLGDHLNVVFFTIFREEKSEPASANVFPAVLLVEPVELRPVLLR